MNLRTFSTIKIGGPVEQLIRLQDLDPKKLSDLPKPLRVLGNGSNVLLEDQGLKGTVILGRDKDFIEPEILEDTSSFMRLKLSAGIFLPRFAKWSSRLGLTGAEYMVGVPGTIGGALAQNAGANAQEFKDIFLEAEVLDLDHGHLKQFTPEDCFLSYRHSFFKEHSEFLIKSVTVQLMKANKNVVAQKTEANLSYRKERTPYFKPSLGSIFTRLLHPSQEGWIFPGKLIEDAGLKGFQIGGAQVSPVHANYIVNESNASFDHVYELIQEVEKRVKAHSGIDLKREVEIWSDRYPELKEEA